MIQIITQKNENIIHIETPRNESKIDTIIYEHIASIKGLNLLRQKILTIIDSLTVATGYCYASNKYLAERCGCSEITISRSISKLKKMKLITQIKFDGRYRYLKSNIKYGDKSKDKKFEDCIKKIEDRYIPANPRAAIVCKADSSFCLPIYKEEYKYKYIKEKNYIRKEKGNFEEFWDSYPRKVGKASAKREYIKVVNEGTTHEEIMSGLKEYIKYIESRGLENKYIKFPKNFLGFKCWNEEYEINTPVFEKHSYNLDDYANLSLLDFCNCGDNKTIEESKPIEESSYDANQYLEDGESFLMASIEETQKPSKSAEFDTLTATAVSEYSETYKPSKNAPKTAKNETLTSNNYCQNEINRIDSYYSERKNLQKNTKIGDKTIEKNNTIRHNMVNIQTIYIYIYKFLYVSNNQWRGLLRLRALNTRISRLMIELLNIQLKKKDIESTVVRGQRISDLPRDTSKLSDEIFVSYIEKIGRLENMESLVKDELENLKEAKEMLLNTINAMPECEIKEIAELYFISESKIDNICATINKSKQHVYSVIADIRKQLKEVV